MTVHRISPRVSRQIPASMAHRSCREIAALQLCFPAARDPGTAIADQVESVHARTPLSFELSFSTLPVPTMPTPAFSVPLPASWPKHAKSATLHVISLAHFALTQVRGWAANSPILRVRLAAERDQL